MKREDLHPKLQQIYSEKKGCGVTKVDHEDYKNIWFVVPPSPPKTMPQDLPRQALSKANRVLNNLLPIEQQTEIDQIVSYLFLRQEAVSSSRMEGTWSTIDHVLTPASLMIGENQPLGTASIRSYAEVLEQKFKIVAAKKYQALTLGFLQDLHRLIAAKDPSFVGKPGALRSPGKPGSIVQIGGLNRKEDSIYNPTPPQHVRRCLEEVVKWFQDDLFAEAGDAGLGMPLVARIAIGHAHFEAVHPFSDGNGRVGRMLWPFQMILAGFSPLYLSGYIEAEKGDYYRGLEVAQKKLDYRPLIEFMCEAFDGSFREAASTKEALINLPHQWHQQGEFRKNSAADRIIPLLIKMPVVNANIVAEQLNISFQAASQGLNSLALKGIVRERTGFERNRIFAAEEVIAVLARDFGSDPKASLARVRVR